MAYSKEQIAEMKKKYPHDTRIQLQYMSGEPDMPEGLRGTVDLVSDDGIIYVHWDNGRALSLGADEDRFRKLTFEEESAEWMTAKFYSPLLVKYFEVSDSEYLSDQRISGFRDLTNSEKYINEISDAIKFNTQSYGNQEEFFISGISDHKIADNVMTLDLSVEAHNGTLWGVTTLQHKYPFAPNQINSLKGYIEDEYENYWGKQFKHQDIVVNGDGHYRINVHFWQDTDDYMIMSESEFNQIKLSEPLSAPAEKTAEEELEPVFNVIFTNKNKEAMIDLPTSEYHIIDFLYKHQCDTFNMNGNEKSVGYQLQIDNYYTIDPSEGNLHELNYLAKQVADFDEYQKISFDAYINSHDGVTVKRLINAAHNINDIMWHPVGNDTELGEFALDNELLEEYNELPDNVYEALDRAKAGAKYREQDGGKFVNGGYLVTNEFDEVYDGITLPDSEPLSPFQVSLYWDDDFFRTWIDLPASDKTLSLIATDFATNDIHNLNICDFRSAIPYFNTMNCEISMNDFDELNALAKAIQNMDQADIRKFKAVLEVEQPFFIKDALDICDKLNQYNLYSHLTDPNDYGKMMVCEKLGIDYDDAIIQFIDNTEFGAELMRRNGIIPTQYGGLIVPQAVEETMSADNDAEQDVTHEDESEDQGFSGMIME